MKIEILIAIICIVGLITTMPGCAINESSESLELPVKMADGTIERITWKSKIWQGLFLYWSKTKQIEKDTPFTITKVGEMESKSDPNSIKAASGSALNLGLKLLKP